MSNEIEIVVKTTDRTNTQAVETKVDAMLARIKAQGAKGGKNFGDEFNKNASAAVTGKRSVGDILGDSMLTGLQRYQSKLREAQKNVADLWKEMEAGSSRSGLAKELADAEREAKNLSAWVKKLGGDLDDASKKSDDAGSKVGFFGRSAQSAGDSLSRAFPTGSAFFNPVILGAAGAVLAIGAIPAAATIAGLALTGVGAGFIGAAAMSVKSSVIVQGAAKSAAGAWSSEFKKAGQGTEQHFVKSLNILEGTAKRVGPVLGRVFEKVTPSTEVFARGLDSLIANSLPGLEHAGEASAGVMDAFSAKLPDLGNDLDSFFESLADGAEGGKTAIGALVGFVGSQLVLMGEIVEHGSKAFDFFTKEGTFGAALGGGSAALVQMFSHVDEGQKRVKESAEKAKEEDKEFAAAQRAVTEALEAGTHVLADYADNLQIASGNALSVSRSQDAVIRSRQELADGIKKHGAALTGDSKAALDNRDALRKGMEAANRHAEALEKDGMNQGQAALERDKDIASLRAWAVQQGMSTKEVDNFINSVDRIRPTKNTKVGAPGAVPSKDQVNAFNQAVGRIMPKKGTQTYTNAPSTKAQVEALERSIYSVPSSRTTTFYADIGQAASNINKLRQLEHAGSANGGVGHVTHRATGGAAAGWSLLGEEGPELVKLPQGSSIFPARQSSSMMAGAGGGGGGAQALVLSFAPGTDQKLAAAILEMLRYEVRTSGRGSAARLLQPAGTA